MYTKNYITNFTMEPILIIYGEFIFAIWGLVTKTNFAKISVLTFSKMPLPRFTSKAKNSQTSFHTTKIRKPKES